MQNDSTNFPGRRTKYETNDSLAVDIDHTLERLFPASAAQGIHSAYGADEFYRCVETHNRNDPGTFCTVPGPNYRPHRRNHFAIGFDYTTRTATGKAVHFRSHAG
jgi:hypothetical protein